MLKAYKYRIYPNKKQEELIQKTFGCCRFIYNNCLNIKITKYKEEGLSLSKIDLNNYCNRELKIQYKWLKEIDKFALTNSIYNMNNAFQKFFKEHGGYPKFKSKRNNKKSYKTNFVNNNIEVNFDNNKIKLPKLKWVKAKIHRKFIGKIKSVTISQVPSGKYYVSILIDADCTPLKYNHNKIGIDLGIKDLLITSNGDKFDNVKTLKKYENKLSKEQRKLSHKVKGSNNFHKQRIKVARLYEKIHNTRVDYLHKISHKLINENQVIVSEDLSISTMVKNHNMAKSILDCGWHELIRQLEYKAKWNNRDYIKIDRYYPSSQTCSNCGYINKDIKKISIREWICPECNTYHDRDINASINILHKGLRLLDK